MKFKTAISILLIYSGFVLNPTYTAVFIVSFLWVYFINMGLKDAIITNTG